MHFVRVTRSTAATLLLFLGCLPIVGIEAAAADDPSAPCRVVSAPGHAAPCCGDCAGDGAVTVDEVVRMVGMILGGVEYEQCPAADATRDGQVTVDELLTSVNVTLEGCPQAPPHPPVDCDAGQRFCNIAAVVGIAELSFGKGAAMVDIDGDGWDDIWASDSDERLGETFGISRLYRNRGDGTFAAIDTGIDPEHLHYNWTASFADADNDGDPDVLLVNGGFSGKARLRLYRNDWATLGKLIDVTAESGLTDLEQFWWGASWADFDLDGRLDFFVNPIEGPAFLYRNVGALQFVDVSAAMGIDPSEILLTQRNPVWFDYDGDGDSDLYRSGLVRGVLYRNDREAGFADVSDLLRFAGSEIDLVFAAAAADFNHDGRDDLYVGRWTRQDYVLRNEGDGRFTALGREVGIDKVLGDPFGSAGLADPNGFENTMGLLVGDFNDDGSNDVLIGTGNPAFRYNDIVYCNAVTPEGSFAFTRCSQFVIDGHGPSQTHGMALGDTDQDGDTDLFCSVGGMATADGMPPAVGSRSLDAFYRQSKSPGATAVIRLEGTTSNRDAVGATYRVDGSAPSRFYAVRSTQGFQSQNSPWQVLPLGPSGHASVSIQWPSGRRCSTTVFAGERVRIIE